MTPVVGRRRDRIERGYAPFTPANAGVHLNARRKELDARFRGHKRMTWGTREAV
jgi:hypothetical protein